MTEKDARKILAVIMVTYPNYKLDDISFAAKTWANILEDYTYEQVDVGLKAYIRTSASGFAPTPGQVIEKICEICEPQELNEQAAWSLVANALRNSGYHADEEFSKLPPLVQKAVGQPSQLRQWALDENFKESVAMSNFMRAYNTEVNRSKELRKMPPKIAELIQRVNTETTASKLQAKKI